MPDISKYNFDTVFHLIGKCYLLLVKKDISRKMNFFEKASSCGNPWDNDICLYELLLIYDNHKFVYIGFGIFLCFWILMMFWNWIFFDFHKKIKFGKDYEFNYNMSVT